MALKVIQETQREDKVALPLVQEVQEIVGAARNTPASHLLLHTSARVRLAEQQPALLLEVIALVVAPTHYLGLLEAVAEEAERKAVQTQPAELEELAAGLHQALVVAEALPTETSAEQSP